MINLCDVRNGLRVYNSVVDRRGGKVNIAAKFQLAAVCPTITGDSLINERKNAFFPHATVVAFDFSLLPRRCVFRRPGDLWWEFRFCLRDTGRWRGSCLFNGDNTPSQLFPLFTNRTWNLQTSRPPLAFSSLFGLMLCQHLPISFFWYFFFFFLEGYLVYFQYTAVPLFLTFV